MCGGGEHFAWQALEQELGTINCQSLRRWLKLSSMVGQIRSFCESMVKEFEVSFLTDFVILILYTNGCRLHHSLNWWLSKEYSRNFVKSRIGGFFIYFHL